MAVAQERNQAAGGSRTRAVAARPWGASAVGHAALVLIGVAVPLAVLPAAADPVAVKATVFGLLVLCLVICGVLAGEPRPLLRAGNPLLAPSLTLAAVYLLSAVVSPLRHLSLGEAGTMLGGTALVAFAPFCLSSFRRVRSVLVAISLGGALVAVYGVLEHFGVRFIAWDRPWATVSTYGNTVLLTSYLVLALPVALGVVASLLAGDSGSVKASYRRWAPALALSLGCYAILACLWWVNTRIGWVALGAAGAFSLAASARVTSIGVPRRRLALAAGVCFVLLALACATRLHGSNQPYRRYQADRMAEAFSLDDPSNQNRALLWEGGLRLFIAHPILGTGPGTFGARVRPVLTRPITPAHGTVITHAHNEFIERLATTGAMGAIAWLWLVVAVIRGAYLTARRTQNPRAAVMAVSLGAGVVGFVVAAQTSPCFQRPGCVGMFWLAAAVLASLATLDRTSPASSNATGKRSGMVRAVLAVPVGAASLVVAAALLLALFSETQLQRGQALIAQGRYTETRAVYGRTVALDPLAIRVWYDLGYVCNALEDHAAALQAYKRLQTLWPDYADVHLNAGYQYLQLGDFREAWQEYMDADRLSRSPLTSASMDAAREYIARAQRNNYAGDILRTDAGVAAEGGDAP